MKYVWVLNNDTEVDKEALTHLISKCDSDKKYRDLRFSFSLFYR